MYCKYCGMEHTAQQKFCAGCGKELQEKKKKPISTIILGCLTGLFAVSTIILGISIPRQYQAGRTEGYELGYSEGEAAGYETGFTEGIEKFDEGYAIGWEQKQAVIDADIAQTAEYKSWAKAYPELGKTDVDDDLVVIYSALHTAIDNWYKGWQEDAYDRIVDNGGSNTLAEYEKYIFLKRVLSYSIDAVHNIIDNLMLFENDHLKAKTIFYSAYRNLEISLEDNAVFDTMTSYERWLFGATTNN